MLNSLQFKNKDSIEHINRFLDSIVKKNIEIDNRKDYNQSNNGIQHFIKSFFFNLDTSKKFYFSENRYYMYERFNNFTMESQQIVYELNEQLIVKVEIPNLNSYEEEFFYRLGNEVALHLRSKSFGDAYVIGPPEIKIIQRPCNGFRFSRELCFVLPFNIMPSITNKKLRQNYFYDTNLNIEIPDNYVFTNIIP